MNRADSVIFDGREYPLTITYSKKRRTLGITVKPDEKVILHVPLGYPRGDALSFAQEKAAWIAGHVDKFRARSEIKRRYKDGETIPFFGKNYTIRRKTGDVIRAQFCEDELLLSVPADFTEEDTEDALRSAVIFLYRRSGTAVLKPLVEKYAKLCGVEPPLLRVRIQGRKWGCCTPKNGIIINVKMMLAPLLATEYLVVHEVVHLKQRNHQQGFWDEVRRLMPEFKKAEALLKSDGWMWEF